MNGYLVEGNAGLAILFISTKTAWHNPSKEDIEKFLFGPTNFAEWESSAEVVEVWKDLSKNEILVDAIYGDKSGWNLLAVRNDRTGEVRFPKESISRTFDVLEELGVTISPEARKTLKNGTKKSA
jgi:hypothetical protein